MERRVEPALDGRGVRSLGEWSEMYVGFGRRRGETVGGLEVRCKPAKAGAPGLRSAIRVFSLAIVGPRSDGAPP